MFNFIVLQKLPVQTDQVPVSGGEKVEGSLISKRYRENWWTSKETVQRRCCVSREDGRCDYGREYPW